MDGQISIEAYRNKRMLLITTISTVLSIGLSWVTLAPSYRIIASFLGFIHPIGLFHPYTVVACFLSLIGIILGFVGSSNVQNLNFKLLRSSRDLFIAAAFFGMVGVAGTIHFASTTTILLDSFNPRFDPVDQQEQALFDQLSANFVPVSVSRGGASTCAAGCSFTDIGDNFCDVACNVTACGFDATDCGVHTEFEICDPQTGCKWGQVGDFSSDFRCVASASCLNDARDGTLIKSLGECTDAPAAGDSFNDVLRVPFLSATIVLWVAVFIHLLFVAAVSRASINVSRLRAAGLGRPMGGCCGPRCCCDCDDIPATDVVASTALAYNMPGQNGGPIAKYDA